MVNNFFVARGKLVGAALLALASPALAADASLAMLDQLAAGQWELRNRSGAVVQRICVARGRELVQLRHPGRACESYVLKDTAGEVEVQFTCRGHGYGRTLIRRETNRLVQIQSQGIADGLPFELAVEARRIGDCKPG